MEKKIYDYNGTRVTLKFSSYQYGGSLAVALINADDGELYGVATVNLCDPVQSDTEAFVDENNLPGIGDLLEENGIATAVGFSKSSGYCRYPFYRFNIQ